MALAFSISHPSDLPRLFAAHDEYSSILNSLFGRILTPRDDFYTAPWAFMPHNREYGSNSSSSNNGGGGNGNNDGEGGGGLIIFTCRVPWLHGCGYRHHNREQHFLRAREIMKESCSYYNNSGSSSSNDDNDGSSMDDDDDLYARQDVDVPYVETCAEKFQQHMMLNERNIHTFTHDGNYPDENDIGQALEDTAIEVTCKAMGWEIPPQNWREEREMIREMKCVMEDEVFDLKEYDVQRGIIVGKEKNGLKLGSGGKMNKRMKYTTVDSHAEAATTAAVALVASQQHHNDKGHHGGNDSESDGREEKKDAFHDNHHQSDDDENDGEQYAHIVNMHPQQQQMTSNPHLPPIIDPYDTLIPTVSNETRQRNDSFQELQQQQQLLQQSQHDDSFYDDCPSDDAAYDNSYGDNNSHNDSFYDEDIYDDDDEEYKEGGHIMVNDESGVPISPLKAPTMMMLGYTNSHRQDDDNDDDDDDDVFGQQQEQYQLQQQLVQQQQQQMQQQQMQQEQQRMEHQQHYETIYNDYIEEEDVGGTKLFHI